MANEFVIKNGLFVLSGVVGIGTSSPSDKVEILQLAAGLTINTKCYSTTDAQCSILEFRKSHSDTEANVATVDGENLGMLNFCGQDTAPGNRISAKIMVKQDGDATAGQVPTKIEFMTDSTTHTDREIRVVINEAGNVAIGNNPSLEAWSSSLTALQIGGNASIAGDTSAGASKALYVMGNAYYDGSFKRISEDEATRYVQNGGQHYFDTVASDTADSTISWTRSLTIDASGNVGIGTTDPDTRLHIEDEDPTIKIKGTESSGAHYNRIEFYNAIDNKMLEMYESYYGGSTDFILNNISGDIVFQYNSTEQMRIDSSGNVGIGVTEPTSILHIKKTNVGGDVKLVIQNNDASDVNTKTSLCFVPSTADSLENFLISVGRDDDMRFTTNAIERMVIDGAGLVGIGTTSPSFTLHVVNSTSQSRIQMKDVSVTVNDTNYLYALDLSSRDVNIASDVTDSGYRIGLGVQGYINDAGMLGTLQTQYGIWCRHGHYGSSAGTITTSYGLYIDSLLGGSTTITNLFALYQEESTAINYFAGNVGIGTTAPGDYDSEANHLVVKGSTHAGITLAAGTTSTSKILFADGTSGDTAYRGFVFYSHDTDGMYIGTDATTRLMIDSGGNVGIGPTSLEAWNSIHSVLQLGGNASLMAQTAKSSGNSFHIMQNAYNDGAWKYISTDEASNYQHGNGTHIFRVAASGTADTAITWIEAMTIDNDGNVGILDTTPSYELDVNGDLNVTGAFRVNGTPIGVGTGYWLQNGSNVYYNSPVGIGTSSPDAYNAAGDNLVIYEAGYAGITIAGGTSDVGGLYFADGTTGNETYRGFVQYNHGSDMLNLGTSGNESLRIDSAGNAGFNIDDFEAWNSSWTALQIGGNSSFMGYSASGAGSAIHIMQNAYYDGTWKYQDTDEASAYFQQGGEHIFRVTSSGTADAAITWTEAMRIDSAGNVGIGNASLEAWHSAYTALQIGGNASLIGTTAAGAGGVVQLLQNAYKDGVGWKYISTDEASRYYQQAGKHYFTVAASGTADAAISWTTAMTINSTGEVGIGTSSPGAYNAAANNLVVYEAGDAGLTIATGTSDTGSVFFADGTSGTAEYMGQINYNHASNQMNLVANNITTMSLDSAGNVGIGNSSLEAWGILWSSLQIGGNSTIHAHTEQGEGKGLYLVQNAYHDGDWKYISTDEASRYRQFDGEHKFYVAVSGTADAVITWTEAMTIANDGNVGMGVTPEAWDSSQTALQIGGNASLYADTAAGTDGVLQITHNVYFDGSYKYISTDEASRYYQTNGTHVFSVAASGTADTAISFTNALKIGNDGNIGMGITSLEAWNSALSALQIGGNAAISANTTVGTGKQINIVQNAYNDGAWKYLSTDEASDYQQYAGTHKWRVAASGTADAAITWTTAMTIDNAGLITALPTYSNDMDGDTVRALYINDSGELGYDSGAGGGAGWADKIEEGNSSVEVVDTGTGYIVFTVDASEAMRIDDSGNVGINVTPESWASSLTALQVGGNGCIAANTTAGASTYVILNQNAYHDGTSYKYISTDEASSYQQTNGAHYFKVVTSGTADTAITWNTVMAINNDGNVGIGVSTLETWHPVYSALQIGGNASLSGSTTAGVDKDFNISQNAYYDYTNTRWEYQDTDEATSYQQTSGQHKFYVTASGTADTAITWTEGLRIDNAGRLGIGGITPSAYHADADNIVIYENGNTGITIISGTSNTGNLFFADGPTGTAEYMGYVTYDHSANKLHLGAGAQTVMTLNGAGNVGFRNSSPQNWYGFLTALQIGGNASIVGTLIEGASADLYMLQNAYRDPDGWNYISTDEATLYNQSDGRHLFYVAASGTADAEITWTNGMIIDNSGNVGVGLSSLEAWSSGFTALQIGGNASLIAHTAVGDSKQITILQNSYYDGSWKYISTDEASNYTQVNGTHTFKIAASGTADAEITFTTAMTIDNAGRVGIGTNAPGGYYDAADDLVIYNSAHGGMTIAAATAGYIYFADATSGTGEYAGYMVYDHTVDKMYIAAGAGANGTLTLDSAGNVGIGTTSPDNLLHIYGGDSTATPNAAAQLIIENSGTSYLQFLNTASDEVGILFGDPASVNAASFIYSHSSNIMRFTANQSEVMRFDAAGNVGIGVTPEAWSSSFTALQIGGNGALMSTTTPGASSEIDILQNTYYDGASWRYISTDETSRYRQRSGAHDFLVAASGTADAAITWTTVMTIDNAGKVNIGGMYASTYVQDTIINHDVAYATSGNYNTQWRDNSCALFRNNNSSAEWTGISLRVDDSEIAQGGMYLVKTGSYDGDLVFAMRYDATNQAERMRITSDGNVGIGNSSLEAWHSSLTALQLGGNASLYAHTTQAASGSLYANQNAYNDGTWKYISTDEASQYYQANGLHYFRVAVSGTADAAITWTTAMTIDNSGLITALPTYSNDMNGDTYRDLLINDSGELGYDSSTIRKKTNVTDMEDVSWIYSLRPVNFEYKVKNIDGAYLDKGTGKKEYGLIAEEVEEINKSFVFYEDEAVEGVEYKKMIPVLLKALQEQQAMLLQQGREIEELKLAVR